MADVTLYFPYIAVQANGTKMAMTAPTVTSLPTVPTTVANVVLTVTSGTFIPGAYQYVTPKSRWVLLIDYQTICNTLFSVAQAFTCFPNAGDNLLPIGSSGSAIVTVYRNGSPVTAFHTTSTGISLDVPAVANDVFLVSQLSPLTPTTALSGGGISDAPNDGTAYVRQSASWTNIQNQLTEGVYHG